MHLETNFQKAGENDDLKYSINYAVVSRNILNFMKENENRNFTSIQNIANEVSEVLTNKEINYNGIATVKISSDKSEMKARRINYVARRSITEGASISKGKDEIQIENLQLLTVIGVFTFERLKKQFVSLDIRFRFPADSYVDYEPVLHEIITYVENSNFKTVEALVMKVGQLITQNQIPEVEVNVTKPNAITFADGVGVGVTRTVDDFEGLESIVVNDKPSLSSETFNLPTSQSESDISDTETHTAYIAFGSNQGKQLENINQASKEMNDRGIKILATSSLYESAPMYYLNQPNFINGVFKVATKLSPMNLLKELQDIETNSLHRVKEIEKGPRSIDLDIVLYDEIILNTPVLTIPHIGLIERTFVLQPLCELLSPDAIHPVTAEPYHNHLKQLISTGSDKTLQTSSDLQTIIPIPRLGLEQSLRFETRGNHRTLIMGILNVTPDSFSDGGRNHDSTTALKHAKGLLDDGADIIDIGGVSTRPGSVAPTEEEELQRVVPVIKAIRASDIPGLANVIISVDTYRSKVAEESILAGADIINDISMGLYDEKIFDVVAKYGVPYIANHTRGTSETMSSLTVYKANEDENVIEYGKSGVVTTRESEILCKAVSLELSSQLEKAYEAGVKKWQIIIDPGLGFAKTLRQNISLIRDLAIVENYSVQNNNKSIPTYINLQSCPILVGPSRKRFIGTITNVSEAIDRDAGTASCIASCIGNGADIVRVHNVKLIKPVCLISDAIHNNQLPA